MARSPRPKKRFNPIQEHQLEEIERLNCRASILEAGVTSTFKKADVYYVHQMEVEESIKVLQEAVELRKKANLLGHFNK